MGGALGVLGESDGVAVVGVNAVGDKDGVIVFPTWEAEGAVDRTTSYSMKGEGVVALPSYSLGIVGDSVEPGTNVVGKLDGRCVVGCVGCTVGPPPFTGLLVPPLLVHTGASNMQVMPCNRHSGMFTHERPGAKLGFSRKSTDVAPARIKFATNMVGKVAPTKLLFLNAIVLITVPVQVTATPNVVEQLQGVLRLISQRAQAVPAVAS